MGDYKRPFGSHQGEIPSEKLCEHMAERGDALRPARGCLNGILMSAVIWIGIGMVWVALR